MELVPESRRQALGWKGPRAFLDQSLLGFLQLSLARIGHYHFAATHKLEEVDKRRRLHYTPLCPSWEGIMSTSTVNHLGVEYGHRFFAKVHEASNEAKLISEAMSKAGLDAQPERTHLFSVFSPDSEKAIAVSITPFSSKDLNHEGGLSISEGGHAQGVIVEMKRNEIVGFTHLAVTREKLVSSKHSVSELAEAARSTAQLSDASIKAFAEKVGKVKAARPLVEMNVQQVRSLATISYNALLGDQFAREVHSANDITALRGMSSVVAEIALFVLFRTEGSSCCSCSCSCWGSSSCSSSYSG